MLFDDENYVDVGDIDVTEMLASEDEGKLKGVENNAESRFIDYSFATPCESFIADIETILRTWQQQQVQSDVGPSTKSHSHSSSAAQHLYMELDYLDVRYALVFYSNKRHTNQYIPPNTGKFQHQTISRVVVYARQVSLCYNLTKFVLLTALGGTGMNKQRHIDKAIQSALYIATDSSCIEIPTFYYCGMGRKHSSSSTSPSIVTTVGYGVTPIEVQMPLSEAATSTPMSTSNAGKQDEFELLVIGNVVSHYSTDLYFNISPNHSASVALNNEVGGVDYTDLYYCDGLWDFFKEKLAEYSDYAENLPDRDSAQMNMHTHLNPNSNTSVGIDGEMQLVPTVKVVETFSYSTSISNDDNLSNANSNYFKRLLVLYHHNQCTANDPDQDLNGDNDNVNCSRAPGDGVASDSMYGDAKLDVATSPVNSGINHYQNNADYLSILQLFNSYCKPNNAGNGNNATGGELSVSGNNYRNFKWLKDIVITIEYSNVISNEDVPAAAAAGETTKEQTPCTPLNKHGSILESVHPVGLVKTESVVDNEYYTNLLPSKQAPGAWNISTVFYNSDKHHHVHHPAGTSVSEGVSTSVLGHGLRKLLALYLFGKATGRAQGGVTNSKSLLDLPIDLHYVDGVCDALSLGTKQTVMSFCNAAANDQTASRTRVAQTRASLGGGSFPPFDIPLGTSGGVSGGFDEFSSSIGETNPNVNDNTDSNAKAHPRNKYSHPLLAKIFLKKHLPTSDSDSDSVQRVFNQLQDRLNEANRANGVTSTSTKLLPLYHWLSLCSTEISECDSIYDMSTLWYEHIVKLQLRGVNWENRQVITNMNPTKVTGGDCYGDTRHTSNIVQCYNKNIPNFATMLGYEGEETSGNDTQHGYATTLLWDDVVQKHAGEESRFCLPDLRQSLLCQKLQMLQMCIVCVDEEPFVNTESTIVNTIAGADVNADTNDCDAVDITPPKLLRRLPYTSDNTAYYYHLLTKSKSVQYSHAWKDSIKEQMAQLVHEDEDGTNSNTSTRVEYASLSTLESLENRARTSSCGQTTDSVKPDSDSKPSCSALLRYSIRVPHIISDIRCYRVENVQSTFAQFKKWYKAGPKCGLYSLEESDVGLECWFDQVLCDIWNLVDTNADSGNSSTPTPVAPPPLGGSSVGESLPALTASQMKPLFRVEQEAEKALGYLENIPITTLAVECLCNRLVSTYVCICVQLSQSRHGDALGSTLALLCDSIVQVLPLLQQEEYVDSSVYNTKLTRDRTATNASYASVMSVNSLDDSVFAGEFEEDFSRPTSPPTGADEVNRKILMLLDVICNLVDLLVSYDEKLTELECILPNSPRLVELLCKIPQYPPSSGVGAAADAGSNSGSGFHISSNPGNANTSSCAINSKESHDIFQLARIIAIENNKYSNMASTSTHVIDESNPMSNAVAGAATSTGARGLSVDSNRTLSVDSTSSNGKNPQLLHSNYNIDNHKALHHWYSENGRELGFPSMRSVSISFPSKTSTLLPYSSQEYDANEKAKFEANLNTGGVTAGDGFCSNIFASPPPTTSDALHHLTEEMKCNSQTMEQITSYDANTTVYHTIKAIHLNNNSNGIEYNHYNNTLQVCFKYSEVEE